MASCEGVDAAGVLLPHAERDNAMRAAALMDSNFLFMLFYPFGVQFGHHEFIIFTRYRFSLLPKTNIRCIIGNTNKCSILGGRVMTAKEQQFIRLVRGLVDPQTTLDEIKTILCAGLPPAPEVQRPAVLPVPHEKV